MAKFRKKTDKNNEDEILAKYVALNTQAKALEKQIDPLKPIVLAIVKERGNSVGVAGMVVAVAAKPKRKFSDALEAEIRKVEEAKDFVDIKIKRAIEHGEFTVVSAGEYVTVKAAKKDE